MPMQQNRVLVLYLPPETRTLSELRARLFIMALCPDRFCRKLPSGNFHCLILSGEPEANVYLNKKKESHKINIFILMDLYNKHGLVHFVF